MVNVKGPSGAGRRFLALALLAGILAGPRPAAAALVKLSLQEMTQRSKLVLSGEVLELNSYWAPFAGGGECIYTDVKIRVETTLKGKPAAAEVTVQVLGGQVGEEWQVCLEAPRYRKGEKVLVFLREENGKLRNTGWIQGKYEVLPEGADVSTVRGKSSLPIAGDVPLAAIQDEVRRLDAAAPAPSGDGGSAPGKAEEKQ